MKSTVQNGKQRKTCCPVLLRTTFKRVKEKTNSKKATFVEFKETDHNSNVMYLKYKRAKNNNEFLFKNFNIRLKDMVLNPGSLRS